MEDHQAQLHRRSTGSSPRLTKEAAVAAKTLLGCYRNGDASDPDIYVRAVTSVLAEYPSEVIRDVCDPRFGLPAKSKWLPTVSEVKEACEDAMAPVDRRNRELKEAEERKRALAKPTFKRPTLAELKEKYGENWGLSETTKVGSFTSIGDLCKQACISEEEFEKINEKAAKAQATFRANHPGWNSR